MMRKTSTLSRAIAATLVALLALFSLAGCSDSSSSGNGSSDGSSEDILDFVYCLGISYSDETGEYSFCLTDADGSAVSAPGTYPSLSTVIATDGTTHSREALVTVVDDGGISDVVLYFNGYQEYQECQYVMTEDWCASDDYYKIYTTDGERVTDPGEYEAVMAETYENGDGAAFTLNCVYTVTIGDDGTVSSFCISSDDTEDNRYVLTISSYDTSLSFTDLDGNEVTDDGIYIATVCQDYTYEEDSGYSLRMILSVTGYVTVSGGACSYSILMA